MHLDMVVHQVLLYLNQMVILFSSASSCSDFLSCNMFLQRNNKSNFGRRFASNQMTIRVDGQQNTNILWNERQYTLRPLDYCSSLYSLLLFILKWHATSSHALLVPVNFVSSSSIIFRDPFSHTIDLDFQSHEYISVIIMMAVIKGLYSDESFDHSLLILSCYS